MKLSALLAHLPDTEIRSDFSDIEVRAVRDDSRAVEPGDVFVAVRGRSVDGHDFVEAAVERGAAVVVVERPIELGVAQVVVPSGELALGVLASAIVGSPADRLGLIGVTGTNGKTTTTYLIESVLQAAGRRPGVIGTVNYRYGGATYPAPYTTPTPLVLHQALADIERAGCTDAVLEVSSAALAMGRLAGVEFDVAAFANLTQDHLDVHGDMAAYRDAKARLFSEHLAADGAAVINIDDPASDAMIEAASGRRVLRVSASGRRDADVCVWEAETTIDGIRAELFTPRGHVTVRSRALLGHFNVANIALAVGVGEARALSRTEITNGISRMCGVPGRVERVANDAGLDILVDYAHTPDALSNVLGATQPLTRRRLICVFGCGGDRDPDKRPKMGAAVAERADLAVVTSDNPRTEDPRAIIDMILPGVPDPFIVEPDRRVAIRAAIAEATPGDVVVIAGKGHEDYQILGTEKVHFDDREEAARACTLRQPFPLDVVLAETGGTLAHRPDPPVESFARVIIDGRRAAPGDLYVAIRGERLDGHEFCAQAVAAGAAGVVVARGSAPRDLPEHAAVIEVDDPRAALGAIARWHRRRWAATHDGRPRALVAVTGSTGKTTTKELITAALATGGRVHRSAGSFNNETGVPLTLLGLRPHHDFSVVEMGMRAVGDIAYLVEIAEPDVGVVVNAGIAHIGVVGSADAIVAGKSEIFQSLMGDGVAVYPADDERLSARAMAAPRRIGFGTHPAAEVRLVSRTSTADGSALTFSVAGEEIEARTPLVGEHNAVNAACALATAVAAGLSPRDAAAGLATTAQVPMRTQIADRAGRRLLIDCYNANPASARAALQTLAELRGDARAVAILGDMLELGDEAADAHRDIGARAAELDIEVIAVGAHADDYASGARTAGAHPESARDASDAARAALAATAPGDWILIKASRGARLERVVEALGDGARQ